MITVTNVAGTTVTLTVGGKTRATGGRPRHKLIVFPGQNGSEVQDMGVDYEGVEFEGTIVGATMAALQIAIGNLAVALSKLVGSDSDNVSITYGDGTTFTLDNVICEAPLAEVGIVTNIAGTFGRAVKFTVRRTQI